jgi:hypothetical protein
MDQNESKDRNMLNPDVTRLNQFVEDCHLDYAIHGLEPGNPLHGEWHKAHHPTPKCADGTERVWLLKKDHAPHGVIQSDCYDRCCIWGWEFEYLEGEMLERAKWWKEEHGRRNMTEMLEREGFREKLKKPKSAKTRLRMKKPKTDAHKRNIAKSKEGVKRKPFSDEWKKNLSESGIGITWWNNGIENKKSKVSPGTGWEAGRLFPVYEDPKHPEIGRHNAGNLVKAQKKAGLPHGKEYRREVK